MLIQLALSKDFLAISSVVIDLFLGACHVDAINVLGGQQILFDLKLWVVGR